MSDVQTAMARLAQRFLARCEAELPKLKDCVASSTDVHGDLRHIVHKMSGSAGIFGYDAVGTLAAQVEGELLAGQPVATTSLPALIHALGTLLAERSSEQV